MASLLAGASPERRRRRTLGLWMTAVAALLAGMAAWAIDRPAPTVRPPTPATEKQALDAYASAPVTFVANAGQTDARVRYTARGPGITAFFTDRGVRFALVKGKRGVVLDLRFVGAKAHPRISAAERTGATVSYLGAAGSQTGLDSFRELTYRELWPGIDMVLRGERGSLKYEFHVAPGADPDAISLVYRGAKGLSLTTGGALAIATSLGTLHDTAPHSVQGAESVASRYRVDGLRYGFDLPRGYDRSRPLVIDPGLSFSTFIGGSSSDDARGVALDAQQNLYIAAAITSIDYPSTNGVFRGGVDAVVTKLSADGAKVLYSTYLGGAGRDEAVAVAVDQEGSAYVTGVSDSPDFPATPGAPTSGGVLGDAFVIKLNPSGTAAAYAARLGGSGSELPAGIALDAQGNAYVAGETLSADFPTTPGALDDTPGAHGSGFVFKLSPTGTQVRYSTVIGGSEEDFVSAIAVDAQGGALLTGRATSTDFPLTIGTSVDTPDAFVTRLSPSGGAVTFSIAFGGQGDEQGRGIALDAAGNAYITGVTRSADMPTTAGAFDRTFNGGADAFAAKVLVSTGTIGYATYLGAPAADDPWAIAVDGFGSALVVGTTNSATFPTTPDAADATFAGISEGFAAKLGPAGALEYSTFIGGSGVDSVQGVALDPGGSAQLVGVTSSADFPTTGGAYDTSSNGGWDAFALRLDFATPPAPSTDARQLAVTVPDVLSLELGPAPPFPAVVPGRTREYEITLSGTATSTANTARLTVHDPSDLAPGHLVNGTYPLPAALRARATSLDAAGGELADVGGATAPTTLLTYAEPSGSDPFTVTLRQPIGARDKLRVGTYAKTLTFTLGAASP
jgi:hypothetical protein